MMRNCRKTLQISSQFLNSYTTQKSYSQIFQKPTSNSPEIPNSNSKSLNSPNYSIPICVSKTHQNPNFLTKSAVIDVLISIKNEPLCAFEFYKWVENQPGFNFNVESFCVLFHILMMNCSTNKVSKRRRIGALSRLFSTLQCSDATVVCTSVVDTAEKFGFTVDSFILNCLFSGFVSVNRIQDAVVCYNWIIDNITIGLGGKFSCYVLKSLFKRNRFETAEEICNKLLSREAFDGPKPICLMMKACIERGKVKEAEKWFIKARERGGIESTRLYDFGVDVVCRKHGSSSVARELLMEMRERGFVPAKWSFKHTIWACLKEGKMKEALMVWDEMLLCGKPPTLMIMNQLMTGYCNAGDLESALSLFETLPGHGLSPDKLTFEFLIEGCCRKGNVERAGELYDLMVEKGIQANVYTSVLMIRRFSNSRRLEKAYEQLMKAGTMSEEKNVGGKGFRPDALSFRILMNVLFKRGEVDEAFKVFDKMMKTCIVGTTFTYNTVIRGLCRLGQTSQALIMLEKFVQDKNFKPSCNTFKFITERMIEEGDINSALSVCTEMGKKSVSPNSNTCTMLVMGLCRSNKLDQALKLQNKMAKLGLELHVSAYEALIDGLWKRKDMENAHLVLSEFLDTGFIPDRKMYMAITTGFGDLQKLKAKPKPKSKPKTKTKTKTKTKEPEKME